MDIAMAFGVLGIDKTKDEQVITSAYRELLKSNNPEDNPEGFKELRSAYEEALSYARKPEPLETGGTDEENSGMPEYVRRAEEIYGDLYSRCDESCWEELLDEPVFSSLDMADDARRELLVFLMSHFYLPNEIWRLIDDRLNIRQEKSALAEEFPPDFLNYITYCMEDGNDSVIPFGLLEYSDIDGDGADIDGYVNAILTIGRSIPQTYRDEKDITDGKLREIEKQLNALPSYGISSPYEAKGRMCVERLKFMKNHRPDGEIAIVPQLGDSEECKSYIRRMEQLIDELSEFEAEGEDAARLDCIIAGGLLAIGRADEAYAICEKVLPQLPVTATRGMAEYLVFKGRIEEAGELIDDAESKCMDIPKLQELAMFVSARLLDVYAGRLENGETVNETTGRRLEIDLGWRMYQQGRIDEAIDVVSRLDGEEKTGEAEYDFYNLYARLLVDRKRYREAYPYVQRWLSLILEVKEPKDKKEKQMVNRLPLAYGMLAECCFDRDERDKTWEYMNKAVEMAKDRGERISFLFSLGNMQLKAEEYEAAKNAAEAMLDIGSDFPYAYVIRMEADFHLQDIGELMVDFNCCREQTGSYYKPYYLAALAMYYCQEYETLEEIIKLAKENSVHENRYMRLLRARLLAAKDENQEALELLTGLLQEKGDEPFDSGAGDWAVGDVEADNHIDVDEIYYLKAYIHERKLGEPHAALDEINEAIRADSGVPLYYQLRGDIYSDDRYIEGLEDAEARRESFKSALRDYDMAIGLGAEPDCWMNFSIGFCHFQLGDEKKGIEYYEKTVIDGEAYGDVCGRLVDYYIDEYWSSRDPEDYEKSLYYADVQLNTYKDTASIRKRAKVLIYGDMDQVKLAAEGLETVLSETPDDLYAYSMLSLCYKRMKDFDREYAVLVKGIETLKDTDTDISSLLRKLGNYYMKQGRYSEACETFLKAAGDRKGDIWQSIGKCYMYMGDFRRAKAAFGKDDDAEYEKDLAELELFRRNTKKAMKLIGKWLLKSSDDDKYWNCIYAGDYCMEYAMNVADAVHMYGSAFGFYKGDDAAGAHFLCGVNRAKAHILTGDSEQARKSAERAREDLEASAVSEQKEINYMPYSATYLGMYGFYHLALGETEKAKECFELMEERPLCENCNHSKCYEAKLFLGIMYVYLGQPEKAEPLFEEALRRSPQDGFTKNMLAVVRGEAEFKK